jgi:beta-catenin-like protein 1
VTPDPPPAARPQQYRWRDPRDLEEAEFMENCFNALCGILAEPESKKLLEEAEGIELMVKMMK